MDKKASRLKRLLREPALAVLVAVLSVLAWSLPLLHHDGPRLESYLGLFAGWGLTVVTLFLLSRGLDQESGAEERHDG